MHLDSDPTNNYASNLRYGSAMCNNAFKIDNGTNAKHGNHGYSKLTLFQVKRIKEFLFIGISQLEISKMFKVSRRNINRIANNVIWQK